MDGDVDGDVNCDVVGDVDGVDVDVDIDGDVNFGVDVHLPVHDVDDVYIHAVHVFDKSQHSDRRKLEKCKHLHKKVVV